MRLKKYKTKYKKLRFVDVGTSALAFVAIYITRICQVTKYSFEYSANRIRTYCFVYLI